MRKWKFFSFSFELRRRWWSKKNHAINHITFRKSILVFIHRNNGMHFIGSYTFNMMPCNVTLRREVQLIFTSMHCEINWIFFFEFRTATASFIVLQFISLHYFAYLFSIYTVTVGVFRMEKGEWQRWMKKKRKFNLKQSIHADDNRSRSIFNNDNEWTPSFDWINHQKLNFLCF